MKLFHIGDVLSVTTERLVSLRHMEGLYDILNFMTGDDLFTHQLPRACNECRPWLLAQYPELTEEALTPSLDAALAQVTQEREAMLAAIEAWLSDVAGRFTAGVMELPVHELGEDMHTRIDPLQELEAMVGKGRIIAVKAE